MKEQSFAKTLGELKHMKVGLFFNDNKFVEGLLLDVKQDHIVVDVDNNVFYFALHQIHALSKNSKDFRVSDNIATYLDRNNLEEILKKLKYNWVTINSLSNQTFVGLLSRVSEDYILIINDDQQFYIQKYYISNIFKGSYETYEESGKTNQTNALQDTHSVNYEPQIQSVYDQTYNTDEIQNITAEDKEIPKNTSNESEIHLINENEYEAAEVQSQINLQNDFDTNREKEFIVKQKDESHPLNITDYLQTDQSEFSSDKGYSVDLDQRDLKSTQFNKVNEETLSDHDDQNPYFRKSKLSNNQINSSENYSEIDTDDEFNNDWFYEERRRKKRKFKQSGFKKCKSTTKKENDGKSDKKQGNIEQTRKMSLKEENQLMEQQYYALMKHSEKMYLQLKNERLGKH